MYLLDTHALVWWISNPGQIPKRTLRDLERNSGSLYFSSISSLEISLLYKKGRLKLPLSPRDYIEESMTSLNLQEIIPDRSILMDAAELPDIHNDPFDRIIIATALQKKIKLVTKDSVIPEYPGIRAVWS